jgi:hypothetical protein
MKKDKNGFKRMIGNNTNYKSIKTEIDPITNEKSIKVDNINPVNREALRAGIENKRRK